jgi:epoxide hydrolase-like predicted phosphatase
MNHDSRITLRSEGNAENDMPIQAVIFDLGGVLVRTEDPTSRQRLAEKLGMTHDELYRLVFNNESARLATVGRVTTRDHWETVRKTLNLSPEAFQPVPEGFWGGDSLDIELVDYIRSLRGAYRTALLSNAWDDLRQVLEEKWRILDAFDEVFISAELGVAKPDPHIFRLVLERLGVSASEAVFVDDFVENVEAARAAGLNAIHFRSAGQARAELERMLKKN